MEMMQKLIGLAKAGANMGEVPIAAAVVAADGTMLSLRHNETEALKDATAHAELLAIREACTVRGEKYLTDCTLYVTLEPCAMCAAAAAHVKIGKVVFGAYDAKGGGVEHGARVFTQATCHHTPEVIGGIEEAACGSLLTAFFAAKRL